MISIERTYETKGNRVCVLMPSGSRTYFVKVNCNACGKELLRSVQRAKRDCFCNHEEQMEYQYANGRQAETEQAHEALKQRTQQKYDAGMPARKLTKRGYYEIYIPIRGWIKEHHWVWEQAGRTIPAGYELHHINGNKLDNRLENLELMQISKHHKLHYEEMVIGEDGRFQGEIKNIAREVYRER